METIRTAPLVREARRLSNLITSMAVAVALLLVLVPPAAYFLIQYDNLRHQAATHAAVGAELVSRHIYGNPQLWRYEEPRLEELLLRSNPYGSRLWQRIVAADGTRVIETGPIAEPPVVTGSAPIRTGERAVGRLEVRLLLRPYLVTAGVVALVCLVLAGGVIAFVFLIPQRALWRAFGRLDAAQRELHLVRDALEQSGELMFIADAHGEIRYRNARFDAVAHRAADGRLPTTLNDFLACLDGVDTGTMMQALADGETWRGRYTFAEPHAGTRHADASCSPIRDSDGAARHFIYVEQDSTERVRMEAQLRDARRMEALGNLAGGIAHDFNNIMTPIMGYAEMLLARTAPDTRERQYVEVILRSTRRARDLVGRILLFGRGGEGPRAAWLLDATVAELLPLLQAALPSNVVIRSDIAEDLSPVEVDPAQMNQLLMNLLTNAAKAMPRGGEIRLGLHTVELEALACVNGVVLSGRYVRLSVADSGMGMDAATLERAFEPFFTTREPGEGAGMGLATVYGIVGQYAGGIVATSRPGVGATFDVYLPVASMASASALAQGDGGADAT